MKKPGPMSLRSNLAARLVRESALRHVLNRADILHSSIHRMSLRSSASLSACGRFSRLDRKGKNDEPDLAPICRSSRLCTRLLTPNVNACYDEAEKRGLGAAADKTSRQMATQQV